MVELRPREYEAPVETIGADRLDELAGQCESTHAFWAWLDSWLSPRERELLALALPRQ